MNIRHIGPDGTHGPERRERIVDAVAAPHAAKAVAARDDGDRVEISAEARALASAADTDAPMSAERLAELREWVAAGAFDQPDVVDTVARRMLARGDI